MEARERKRIAEWIGQMSAVDFQEMESIMQVAKRSRIEGGTLIEVAALSRKVRARYPDAEMIRVAVEERDDPWCMGVGFYNSDGALLALEDYDMRPTWPRTCQSEVEEAWAEGGRDVWPTVEGQDEDDYPGDEGVREVRLSPRP
ncbi:hypothetical protein E1091_03425 [Micromonospora fluostatini]|uniref:Uncharacterized protein n=1 Tax=Micromonospora fluostatini TaxID=1629071 RepID=A0ABY2DKE8_9ACTN|nr:hypothetical protein E1091_03425 [Micromonospora fluostatini]